MELLVATGITLMLLVSVVQLFAWMSTHIDEARTGLEMQDHLRSTAMTLQSDLKGVTVTMNPPRRPEDNEGYFEYIEGPMGVGGTIDNSYNIANYNSYSIGGGQTPINASEGNVEDATVADPDDMLMFTTRTTGTPFVGQIQGYFNSSGSNIQNTGKGDTPTIQSSVAEVAWFARWGTLFRRQMLVAPFVNPPTPGNVPPAMAQPTGTVPIYPSPFGPTNPTTQKPYYNGSSYYHFDVSMHTSMVAVDTNWQRTAPPAPQPSISYVPALKTNTLGDLTKREYRYAHPHWLDSGSLSGAPYSATGPMPSAPAIMDFFPYDVNKWFNIRLPTYRESAAAYFYPNINPSCRSLYAMMNPIPSNGAPMYSTGRGNTGGSSFSGDADWWNTYGSYAVAGDQSLNGSWNFWYENSWTSDIGGNEAPNDVILSHVIGFDVKAWDPGAPIYQYMIPATASAPARAVSLAPGDPGWTVAACAMAGVKKYASLARNYQWVGCGAFVDLGYGYYSDRPNSNNVYQIWGDTHAIYSSGVNANASPNPPGMPRPHFNLNYVNAVANAIRYANGTSVCGPLVRTYDTWSTHYAMNAPDEDPDPTHARVMDMNAHNGFDDDGINGPDDPGETYSPIGAPSGASNHSLEAPYPYPLRAIQVKIRAFEPSSRQIREVTVTQDFLPR
jgi:hypothetical protein